MMDNQAVQYMLAGFPLLSGPAHTKQAQLDLNCRDQMVWTSPAWTNMSLCVWGHCFIGI